MEERTYEVKFVMNGVLYYYRTFACSAQEAMSRCMHVKHISIEDIVKVFYF